jgi:predicted ATP-dependent endonuclease of OLD family
LIDEPEAFLHPPQARLLGMMLSKHTPNTRQLFIATHSEDFLKGLLDAGNENIKIIRIDRIENTNHMNILIDEDIKQFWKDPLLRYSNILSGLFHHKVVICESDSDCRFYQAVINSLYDGNGIISPDILFIHCGGKQRVKMIVSALKSLNVKTITIVDIDVLNDKDVLREIINSYRIKWDDIKSDWNIIDDYVKSQRPQLNKDDVVREITSIFKSIPQSETVFPKSGVEKINRIVKQATAWAKIKETGKVFFSGASYTSFEKIDRICREKGLFIVPVGELEGFYKPITNHGPKWVNSVLETANLKNDLHLSDAHDFVRAIVEY